MGSFLVSCCATNQSISNEEVYVIPIYENVEHVESKGEIPLTGLCRLTYNTDLYGLVGFIFTGVYNDYGQYNIDWNKISNRHMLEKYVDFLNKSAINIEQGSNRFHDVPFEIDKLVLTENNHNHIWCYIHEAIWQGRLFIKKQSYPNKTLASGLNYFVAHKDNLDILLDLYNSKQPNNFRYYSSDEEKEFYLKDTEGKAKHLFDEVIKKESDKLDPNYDPIKSAVAEHILSDNRLSHFLGDSGYSDKVACRPNIRTNTELVLKYENDYESYLEIYKAFVTMQDIVISLSYCNIVIRPVYYASQDYSNELGLRFSYWMEKIHKQNVQDFKEYSEAYDENDPPSTIQLKLELEIEKAVRDFN